jgi:hypothetical protein
MAITIYWACFEDEWVKADEPEKVLKRFYSSKGIQSVERNHPMALNYCPVFNQTLGNTYAVKSIYDYSFKIQNNKCVSLDHGQRFFDEHIIVRSIDKKFFSYQNRYIFFTEEDSLIMNAYQHPIFEENEISKRCMIIPGSFDIGKYFRNLEFSFILKDGFDEFVVKNNDVLYYLTFDTKEKIEFKQFRGVPELTAMIQSLRRADSFNLSRRVPTMDVWYNKFKGKKWILNKIKENLLD